MILVFREEITPIGKHHGLGFYFKVVAVAAFGESEERIPLLPFDSEKEQVLSIFLDGRSVEYGVGMKRHVLDFEDGIVLPASKHIGFKGDGQI